MSKLLNCLREKKSSGFPIWFMRQAGRHLPEFRNIRKKNKNFIKLCLNSDLSSKITLQPIYRYNLDAAIIFSDILIVPYVLGQRVVFKKGKGPYLSKFNLKDFLNKNNKEFTTNLKPVYEAIKKTRKKLNKKKSLISFVGAPWTLLIYMIAAKNKKNKLNNKIFKEFKNEIDLILERLIKFLCLHIENQKKAGSDVVQIFDSWAGLIPIRYLKRFCYEPNLKLVNFCKRKRIPVICFPKGIKNRYKNFVDTVKPDGISIDYDINPTWARKNLKNVCIQGGLDPKLLIGTEKKLMKEINKYLKVFKHEPYIFNLGHGLLPKTNHKILERIIHKVNTFK